MKRRPLRPWTALALVVMASATQPCFAVEEVTLSLGLFTQHVNPADDSNQNNRFLAVGIDRWMVARYKNSYSNITHFVGRKWQTDKLDLTGGDQGLFLQGNLYAGLLHGYRDRFPNIAGVTVGVAPTLAVGYQRSAFELMYVPTDTGGVFMGLATFTFGDYKSP